MLYPLKIFKDFQTFLVVDLSTHAYLKIKEILVDLKRFLQYLLLFFVTIFLLIVVLYIFLYKEHRRNFIDPLTGIYNRAYLEKLHGKIDLQKIIIAMIDIDYFKIINDTYGHAAGDEVLQEITKRFKKTNNPILSLFLAKQYYKRKEYYKAYNYALITNQIDSTIEESWIVFAKSLVKLGKKEKAIQTLRAYIASSRSTKAEILLNNILTGKFK